MALSSREADDEGASPYNGFTAMKNIPTSSAFPVTERTGCKSFVALTLCFLFVFAVAAAFRIPQISVRPVHGDEANQAVKTGILYDTGKYAYDPHEHHGPTLYYAALPVLYLCGVPSFEASSIVHYRVVPLFFGLLLILLLWPMRKALGGWATLWAALFLAISHPFIFYSRYYVQEMLLVCFVQAVLAAGWWFIRRPTLPRAAVLGLCLGLVHATKETSIVIAFAMVGAIVLTVIYSRLRDKVPFKAAWDQVASPRMSGLLLVTALVAIGISVALFSSFFTHWRGPLDSILTYTGYFSRAEGTGSSGVHDKPWYYYLSLLAYVYRQAGPRWTEGPALFAGLLGLIAVLVVRLPGKNGEDREAAQSVLFRRFLLFYTLITVVVYSVIPYKTPWNLLVFYHGILLIAGVGTAALIHVARWRLLQAALVLVFLAGAAFMARQSYYGNYVYYADARNPYVYAHPSKAVERIAERVNDIARISGEGSSMHINIIRPDGDYWPLPWYLRAYKRVGYWHRIPDNADASVILVTPSLHEQLADHLHNQYMVEFQALRPGILLNAYIRQDLWDAFIKTRSGTGG